MPDPTKPDAAPAAKPDEAAVPGGAYKVDGFRRPDNKLYGGRVADANGETLAVIPANTPTDSFVYDPHAKARAEAPKPAAPTADKGK